MDMAEPEAEGGASPEAMAEGSDPCGTGMMMSYFHTGNCEYILFKTLRTTNAGQMAGACVFIFFLGALYEGFKFMREKLLQRAEAKKKAMMESNLPLNPNGSMRDVLMSGGKNMPWHWNMLNYSHGLQTFLHMVQVFVSYCLMLVFMSYHVYLGLAVILGAGAGFFIFGLKRSQAVDVTEHCH